MKRIYLLFSAVFLFLTGCSKSLLDKADEIIQKEIPLNLYIPESYDPIETQLDSAFAPVDDINFQNLLFKIDEEDKIRESLEHEMKMLKNDISTAKSEMCMWAECPGSYGRNAYNEAKTNYNEHRKIFKEKEVELKNIEQKLEALSSEINNLLKKEWTFIGYKAIHRYRAKTNSGNILIGGACFYFDPEITQIIKVFDLDEYEAYVKAINDLYDTINE